MKIYLIMKSREDGAAYCIQAYQNVNAILFEKTCEEDLRPKLPSPRDETWTKVEFTEEGFDEYMLIYERNGEKVTFYTQEVELQ
jgi:hypothetical protein